MRVSFTPILLLVVFPLSLFSQVKLQVIADTVRVIDAELVVRNASKNVAGYLVNTGNGVTQFQALSIGKSIQFTVGDSTYAASGDTTYTNAQLKGYTLKVWRSGMFQYYDSAFGILTDTSLGKIKFRPALVAGEKIYIEAVKGMGLYVNFSSTGNGNNTGEIVRPNVLHSGVFKNSNNTFTLRWTTNNTTLTTSPRVVGLGSSTLSGYGLTYPNKLGDKINSWLTANTTSPVWNNLSVPGYTSGNISTAADGGTAGQNIDSALLSNPDFIFISLPSNDVMAGLSVNQALANLRKIDTMALNRGVPVFIETTQPRTAATSTEQTQLKHLADSIRAIWPDRFVEGFRTVVDSAASTDAVILSQYAQSDNIHLTAAANQFIADSLFARWQRYFKAINGVSYYQVETSTDAVNWTSYDQIASQNIVKKTYAVPDSNAHYYRVKAYFSDGSSSAYSNIATLPAVTAPPSNNGPIRVLVDLGGDGVNTLNGSSVADGKLTPSPDSLSKYWNNWTGAGSSAFVSGTSVYNLTTTTHGATPLSIGLVGNPAGSFGSLVTKALNFNGFTTGVRDYPYQALYDNMFVHSSVGTGGVTLKIKGMAPGATYSIKLWGARIDATTTARTLETKLGDQAWSQSQTMNTRYGTTDTAEYNRAIVYTGITGVDTLDINIRTASGSTFAHLSLIDISASGDMTTHYPLITLRDTTVTLPKDSMQLSASVNANGSTITGYQWTQLSGPNTTTFSNASSATTIVRGLTNGIFTYRLIVNTSSGYQAAKDMVLSVYPDNNGKKTLRVNFSNAPTITYPGWFNMYGPVNGANVSRTEPSTSWTVSNGGNTTSYWNPLGGANSYDALGATTGNNSGVVPDFVLANYWFQNTRVYNASYNNLIITGLNPSKTYTIKLVGSRSSSGGATAPRYGAYRINDGSELLHDAFNNTSNYTLQTGVSPDGTGKIKIGVFAPANAGTNGVYSYINAMIVQEE